MVELEHMDETRHEVADRTNIRQWNTMFWAQQNHKIRIFSMGDIALWFPKEKKKID